MDISQEEGSTRVVTGKLCMEDTGTETGGGGVSTADWAGRLGPLVVG